METSGTSESDRENALTYDSHFKANDTKVNAKESKEYQTMSGPKKKKIF